MSERAADTELKVRVRHPVARTARRFGLVVLIYVGASVAGVTAPLWVLLLMIFWRVRRLWQRRAAKQLIALLGT
jgi:hypothetical protein